MTQFMTEEPLLAPPRYSEDNPTELNITSTSLGHGLDEDQIQPRKAPWHFNAVYIDGKRLPGHNIPAYFVKDSLNFRIWLVIHIPNNESTVRFLVLNKSTARREDAHREARWRSGVCTFRVFAASPGSSLGRPSTSHQTSTPSISPESPLTSPSESRTLESSPTSTAPFAPQGLHLTPNGGNHLLTKAVPRTVKLLSWHSQKVLDDFVCEFQLLQQLPPYWFRPRLGQSAPHQPRIPRADPLGEAWTVFRRLMVGHGWARRAGADAVEDERGRRKARLRRQLGF